MESNHGGEGGHASSNQGDAGASAVCLAPGGERRESRGRLGYLLSGRLHTADGEAVRPGELFGLSAAGGGRCLTAQVPSTVIWMDREIMTRVCYFDCWFHGRFVTELKQALARQERRTMP